MGVETEAKQTSRLRRLVSLPLDTVRGVVRRVKRVKQDVAVAEEQYWLESQEQVAAVAEETVEMAEVAEEPVAEEPVEVEPQETVAVAEEERSGVLEVAV